MRRDGINWSRFGILIDDARGVLSCLQKLQVHHVKGSRNEAAHQLAEETLSLSEEHVLRKDIPRVFLMLLLLSTILKRERERAHYSCYNEHVKN